MVWDKWFSIASTIVLVITVIAILAFHFRKDKSAKLDEYLQGIALFNLIIYGAFFILARIADWLIG